MIDIDQSLFNENLLVTQAYCELQVKHTDKNTASILRSFNPVYNGREMFSYKPGQYFYDQWLIDPLPANNEYLYNELFEQQLKNKREIIKEANPATKFEGRILIVDIDHSIPDGASQEASDGFIDNNDCPPIDTWFYMVHSHNTRILYAWIPQQFVHLVQDGIDVNALDIFYWQEDYSESRYSKHETSENLSNGELSESSDLRTLWSAIKNMFSK